MKTKNVKIKLDDIKAGVTFYTAHPIYGIRMGVYQSRPYLSEHGFLVADAKLENHLFEDGWYNDQAYMCDDGIVPPLYNDRRTFKKLKHAEAWMRKWVTSTSFIERRTAHEESCFDESWYYDDYGYFGYDDNIDYEEQG